MLELSPGLRGALIGAALSLAACSQSTPGGPADSGPTQTGCRVEFSHRPTMTASSVAVVGEWNAFDRSGQKLTAQSDGTWSGTIQVVPGTWAYAVVENGAEAPPAEPTAIRYVDGKPWAAMRVRDCGKPLLSVTEGSVKNTRPSPGAGRFEAALAVSGAEAITGTVRLPDGTSRPLTGAELQLSDDATSAALALQGLPDGKYTVSVVGSNAKGEAGESLLLPFWVEAEAFTFRDSPLYMLMIDRFRNGDPSNDVPGTGTGNAAFRGGDLQGVLQALKEGYFDALSVKAIWLSPWQTQPSRSHVDDGVHAVSGYHGYWPVKAREVDARFGGEAALKAVVQEAHRHGIRVVMDAVLNHVHADHEYFQDPAKKKWFRTGCLCGSSPECGWDNARLTCLFRDYMPDIDWTNNDAAAQFSDDMLWWMESFDLDGIRVDAVKQVEDAAVIDLAGKVRERFETAGTEYYMFGETFSGDVGLIKHSIAPNALDGQLNFPLFFGVPEPVFARDDQGLQQVRSAVQGTLSDFGASPMVTFVGNHDVARFITKADPANRDRQGNQWDNLPGPPQGQVPYDRLFLAMASLMTTPGVPLIYYGDEYGEFGGADPDNRHLMNLAATYFPEQKNQLGRMQGLLKARAALRGLRRGPQQDLWCNEEPWGQGKGNLYAYARTDADPRQSAVVVLNLTGNTWTNVVLNFPSSLQWPMGTLREHLSQTDHPFAGSTVTVDVPARGAVVLSLK